MKEVLPSATQIHYSELGSAESFEAVLEEATSRFETVPFDGAKRSISGLLQDGNPRNTLWISAQKTRVWNGPGNAFEYRVLVTRPETTEGFAVCDLIDEPDPRCNPGAEVLATELQFFIDAKEAMLICRDNEGCVAYRGRPSKFILRGLPDLCIGAAANPVVFVA